MPSFPSSVSALVLPCAVRLLFAASAPGAVAQDAAAPTVLPLPLERVATGEEEHALPAQLAIGVDSPRARPVAESFAEFWWRLTGVRAVLGGLEGADVLFELVPAGEQDAERHSVTVGDSVRVEAGAPAGLARGAASLLQLARASEDGWRIPRVTIEDAPDCAFRAVLVDVARQPHSISTLRSVVDLLFLYKVRYLHLHLTDDQSFTFPFAPVTDALPDNRAIPLAEWRALVAYAEARGVTIVPELDLPGHSTQLKRSGYLEDPTPEDGLTDRDVAHPVNHARIFAIVDAMLEVFSTSPYFHIGGDESGAREALIPFLAAANAHLRGKPAGERRRLMVWEGFGGRPDVLPATGDDRIVVFAWESAYNPPWNLLDAGYEIVNASWKPLYVVGGGTPRYPHIGGRFWSADEIHAWDRTQFWHWQAGTPVFEDRGPGDERTDDGIWNAPTAQHGQIVGGELLFWEQREHTVLTEAFDRVAALSERLWSGNRPGAADPVGFRRRLEAVGERVRALVQPVRMTVRGDFDPEHPTARDHLWIHGEASVACSPSAGLAGAIRVTRDGSTPTFDSERYEEPLSIAGNQHVVAQLFVDGQPVGAPARVLVDDAPARVRARWFDLPRHALAEVPDFRDRTTWKPYAKNLLPVLRGPYRTAEPVGQDLEATFVVPEERAGEHVFRLQTRDGRARLFLDGAPLLGPSDPSEEQLFATLDLAAGRHALRVHHAGGAISPVLLVAVQRPGDDGFREISGLLEEIPRGTEPEELRALDAPVDLLGDGLAPWTFVTRSLAPLEEVASLTEDGVLRIAGRPDGYLVTDRWYRDYRLDLEWRWPEPERAGNGGVLVHVSTPKLFYGWPRSLEVQLQNGRAGDFWTIGEDVDVLVEQAEERRVLRRPDNLHAHRRIARLVDGAERPLGEWNRLTVLCCGGEVVVRVNGVEVNRGLRGTETEGAIALQSEGAPIEFRNVRLSPLVVTAR